MIYIKSFKNYDECLEYCCESLYNDPMLTLEEFSDNIKGVYRLDKKQIAEIYDTARSYVDSETA